MDTKHETGSGPVSTEAKEPQTQSLSQLFHECLQRYSSLCLALGEESFEGAELGCYVDLERARGELGRLRLWGSQSKATLPAQARGSLDDMLRHDQTLRDKVADMFRLLMHQLDLALRIIRGASDAPEVHAESDGSTASDSDDSSTESDRSDGSSGVAKTEQKTATISAVMSYIYDQVGLLYHLSMLLRRPALTRRYIKSAAKDGKSSAFEQFDYSHIVEKFRHWQCMAESGSEDETSSRQASTFYQEEPVVSESDLRARPDEESAHESYVLMQRLARANTRRREQFRYWAAHPSRPGVSSTGKNIEKEVLSAKPHGKLAAAEQEQEITATGDNAAPRAKSLGKQEVKSVLSAPTTTHSLSTAAVSGIDGARSQGARPRTVYEETLVAADQRTTRVPDVPIEDPSDVFFECPFCHMSLESALMKMRQAWKQHVFRDLRPYVCTDASCPNPDKMYATRHEWVYHEMQMHRRQWTCRDCHADFDTQDLMADHLRIQHPGSWTCHQLPVLMDMCEMPLDQARIVPCPMCSSELQLNRFASHVAEHMEDISLFVIPAISKGDEDAGSHAMRGSRTGERPEAQSTSHDTTLGFSVPDATERPPRYEQSFEQLIRLEEQDSYTKTAGWNSKTIEQQRNPLNLKGHESRVWAVSFSGSGDMLASGSSDDTIRLWGPTTGGSLQTLNGHSNTVFSVAFSPNGKLLASGSSDKTIRLWDPKTGGSLQKLNGHSSTVYSVAFSPNGKLLVSGSVDRTIRLWDPKTGVSLQTLNGHSSTVYSVAFSPNGKLLASGSVDKTIRLWDPTTGVSLQTLNGHSNTVCSVAFSLNGKLLASGSTDDTIKLWDPTTGVSLQTLSDHNNTVMSVAFSSDGMLLASASYDRTVRLWNPETGSLLRVIDETEEANTVTFSPDGGFLAAGFDDGIVRIWEVWSLL